MQFLCSPWGGRRHCKSQAFTTADLPQQVPKWDIPSETDYITGQTFVGPILARMTCNYQGVIIYNDITNLKQDECTSDLARESYLCLLRAIPLYAGTACRSVRDEWHGQ